MAKKSPVSANEFIEQQLDLKIEAIEAEFSADALGFSGGIMWGIDDIVRDVVEGVRQTSTTPRNKLVVILSTGGGYIEVAQRIVELFRHHYQIVDFVIPNYAFSAGTVLALSGDAIHMDYYSRLGPIDPQVEKDGKLVPALGYVAKYKELVAKAQANTISLAEIQLMIDGFDQAALFQYDEACKLSKTLLVKWLAAYKFKNWTKTETTGEPVDEAKRQKRAEEIADQLNEAEKWHSHGRGISLSELDKDLKLKIDDFGKNQATSEKIRSYHRLLDDYMSRRGTKGVLHVSGRYVPYA